MKPGATARPFASMTCLASPATRPISAMRPSAMATSALTGASPEPSYTVPPRMRMSKLMLFGRLAHRRPSYARRLGVDRQAGGVDDDAIALLRGAMRHLAFTHIFQHELRFTIKG